MTNNFARPTGTEVKIGLGNDMWKWLTKRSVLNGAFLVILITLMMYQWRDEKRIWQHSPGAFWIGLYTAIPAAILICLICFWGYNRRRNKNP